MSKPEFIEARSTGGVFPHSHLLRIPRQMVIDPPADGLLLTTSEEYSLFYKHCHQVKLTFRDLESLRSRGRIVVQDADKGRHSFEIDLGPAMHG